MPTALPDVFDYLDYRAFLSAWFQARKAANPRFSHRMFARLAKQKSPSLLLHVIQGKRSLTPATVEAFGRAMKLDPEESAFFAGLVRLDQADTPEERNDAWRKVSASRRFRSARALEGRAFEYLSHWYYVAVRELALRDDFRAEPAWIARTVRPRITKSQAASALHCLLALGLLRDEGGRTVAAEATVVTPHEMAGLAARNYHAGMLDLARTSMERFKRHERHIGGVTVCVSEDLVPRLKEEIAGFQERLLDLCDGDGARPDRVYQVELTLFPLTDARPPESP